MQLQVERITIRNGQVPCQFQFISKPDEETYCKEWLTANPSKGFLLSGELLLLSHIIADIVLVWLSSLCTSESAVPVCRLLV